jgi:hypothetical protein
MMYGVINMKMNQSAEMAFLALPVAIAEFELDMIRRSPWSIADDEMKWQHINNTERALFPKNLLDLLKYYRDEVHLLTHAQTETLYNQLHGEDREAWYLAFVLIDNLKHKLWTHEENN